MTVGAVMRAEEGIEKGSKVAETNQRLNKGMLCSSLDAFVW